MSISTTQTPPDRAALATSQFVVAAGGVCALAGLAVWTGATQSLRHALLLLTGAALGMSLFHASFGFTAAFRVLLRDGRSAGVRAQMLMLSLACILFFPVLAYGVLFGQPVGGFVFPAGISVVVGAFLFGAGMQLGGGCGSGTLFAVGGGNVRMAITLAAFVAGSLAGLEHLSFWEKLPGQKAISLVEILGWPLALAANLATFMAIYTIVRGIELRRHGQLISIVGRSGGKGFAATALQGPWPLIGGAVALALLNFLTLYLAGRPWGITSAFPLWGAKILSAGGIDMSAWRSWADASQQAWLNASVFADITSVMDFGLMLGALLAAGLAGKFRPDWRIPPLQIVSAIVGGLLMGYGARLSYGCNIGAFFSGVASGSLHGWLWIACAMVGNWIGVRLRPWFGMAV